MWFLDRADAGARLGVAVAERLAGMPRPVVVLGIPRGGVVTALEVARELDAPLDVVVTRKIGAPSQPELGIGAVTEDGRAILDDDLVEALDVSAVYLAQATRAETREIRRRVSEYRGDRPAADIAGACCVVVDDGLATGSTARSALAWLRTRGASTLVLAVPVASEQGLALASKEADVIVCLETPSSFAAVGQFYEHFEQVSDEEVIAALQRG